MGRFLNLVVGIQAQDRLQGHDPDRAEAAGTLPAQYDYDVATVYGFLKNYGLEKEVKVNIEQGHAILAGHTFEHELALANALGIFGSIDMNRNDYQSGWDTDQFPNNVPEMALAYYQVSGRRWLHHRRHEFRCEAAPSVARSGRSADRPYRWHGCLRARPEGCGKDDRGQGAVGSAADRYAGWSKAENQAVLRGEESLEAIAARVEAKDINPQPKSGKQELLENVVNRYV